MRQGNTSHILRRHWAPKIYAVGFLGLLTEMKNALFLLILVADIAESAVIRLPLRVVPTTSNLVPRGLKNGQPSKKNANVEAGETGFDWNSLFSSRISPASTGVFGYESLQLSIGLGTPRKLILSEGRMQEASEIFQHAHC